jgi:hypothetical protein
MRTFNVVLARKTNLKNSAEYLSYATDFIWKQCGRNFGKLATSLSRHPLVFQHLSLEPVLRVGLVGFLLLDCCQVCPYLNIENVNLFTLSF